MVGNLSQSVQGGGGDILARTFSVYRQQPNSALDILHVIQDAHPTALTCTLTSPAQLTHAMRSRHDIAQGWGFGKCYLYVGQFGIGKIISGKTAENWQFDKGILTLDYTAMPYKDNISFGNVRRISSLILLSTL
jgi:hypothetical protein